MTKKVAVILAGCGVFDGSEIHETVLTLLSLDRAGAQYQCFAPDMDQQQVINHITGEAVSEQRNILVESARISRGNIQPLTALSADNFDALIMPGGFGVAKNLSDFATSGADLRVQHDVLDTIKSFSVAKKAVGLMCISPVLTGRAFTAGAKCTVGNDKDVVAAIETTGVVHVNCPVNDIVVDEQRKLVTTPAYMLAQSIKEAAEGIEKLVTKVLSLT